MTLSHPLNSRGVAEVPAGQSTWSARSTAGHARLAAQSRARALGGPALGGPLPSAPVLLVVCLCVQKCD